MSTPDLHTRAARFFLLAEQASRLSWLPHMMFWEMSVSHVRDPTAHLPALSATVRKEYDADLLRALALHPLPGVLPPEAVPWHDRLVEAWEVHRASSSEKRREIARRALVRLDGCGMPDGMGRPSRLPEWLEEAWEMTSGKWRMANGGWRTENLEVLAVLAEWRPARGVITPPETLREWVAFWRERRRSRDRVLKGIASRALLNLPEADLRAASLRPVPPEQLLRDLAAAIPAAAERSDWSPYENLLLMLDWQPVEGTAWPAAEAMEVARAWLKVASHNAWWCRQTAWWQLIRWDLAGDLTFCGMDLLPFLVRAAQTEEYDDVSWEMSRWMPTAEVFTATERPDGLGLLRQLETAWQRRRQSGVWWNRTFARSPWLSGIRLHQARLAAEPPDSFLEAYLAAVAQEDNSEVLFVLAQWSPGTEAPAAFHRKWQQGWQRRLGDGHEYIRQVVGFALVHQALERATGNGLRRTTLEVWRAGTKAGDATCRLGALASRFHEVGAQLATGRVPDFEEEPATPAQRQYPRLALPPGHIADRKWRIENEKLKMENHEGALGPANRPAPDGPSR